MTEPGRCAFCGRAGIDEDRDYQRIRAWRKHRHGTNSPNYVRLIEPVSDQWAHAACVDLEANGITATQLGLDAA
jgi:hypothetical protein